MTHSNFVEILLVEDSVLDAEMSILALEEENLANHLIWLKDGADALNFIFCKGPYVDRNISNQPKLILLDLKMPKVGGIEVLKRIREDKRTSKLPVVIMTSSKEETDIIRGYDLGANSYIVKPVDFDKFTKSVKEIGFYWLLINQPPVVSKENKTK
ncbi:MAG: response regulator [Bacteroidetes bacterium]|nr:response regulator [Bacteroidota bacterium]